MPNVTNIDLMHRLLHGLLKSDSRTFTPISESRVLATPAS